MLRDSQHNPSEFLNLLTLQLVFPVDDATLGLFSFQIPACLGLGVAEVELLEIDSEWRNRFPRE